MIRPPVTNAVSFVDSEDVGARFEVPTVAALKKYKPTALQDKTACVVLGFYAPGDGGGGVFYFDASYVGAEVAGLIVAPGLGNGGWRRAVTDYIDAKWCGAKPSNNAADANVNKTAFAVALAFAVANGIARIVVSGNNTGNTFVVTCDDASNGYAGVNVTGSNLTLDLRANLQIAPTTSDTHRMVYLNGASNVRVTGGGQILGVRSGPPGLSENGMLIAIAGGSNLVIENLVLTNSWSDGIYADGGVSNLQIIGVTVSYARRNGISIVQGGTIEIARCKISNVNGGSVEACIDVEPNSGQFVSGVSIHHNTLTLSRAATHTTALLVQNGAAAVGSVTDVFVTNNRVFNGTLVVRGVARGSVDANLVYYDGGQTTASGVYVEANSYVNVTHNVVTGASIAGVWFAGNTHSNVIGNHVLNVTGVGVFVRDQSTYGAHCLFAVVNGNHVENVSDNGIQISGGKAVRVVANHVANAGKTGIYIRDNCEDCTVESNFVFGSARRNNVSSANINVGGAINTVIAHNVLRVSDKFHTGTAQAGAAGAITLDSLASLQDGFYVGKTLFITAGTGSGQNKVITAYAGSSRIATVASNWATPPDSTSVFNIRDTWNVDRHISLDNTGDVNTVVRYNNVDAIVGTLRDNGVGTVTTSDTRAPYSFSTAAASDNPYTAASKAPRYIGDMAVNYGVTPLAVWIAADIFAAAASWRRIDD